MLSCGNYHADSQKNKRSLVTNEFLQVKGFKHIYALGDCATLDQKQIKHRWGEIFKHLDANKDGVIDESEFRLLTTHYAREFPQLLQYAKEGGYIHLCVRISCLQAAACDST